MNRMTELMGNILLITQRCEIIKTNCITIPSVCVCFYSFAGANVMMHFFMVDIS